ncbi:MAG: 1-acyl-sn-glycerol-3-phosphate acyltransferase [Tannerella sp.]|nr:1-acyl-sn-glycerol-3-phosphate acyltransferase [Tannerella sp.]
MLRILYFLYFWLLVAPLFLVATILTALTTIVGCMLGGERIFSFYPGMLWSKIACYLTLCPVRIKGKEHLKKNQSYVFVSNHQSAYDIFLIYGFIGVPIKWMMKKGLGKIPLVGAACRAAGFIFVDNSSSVSARRSIAEAKSKLKNGASLVVFPEGSRTHTGKMGRFRKGAFQLAIDQHLPLVPITLNGPYKVMASNSFRIFPHLMEMVIHPPVVADAAKFTDLKDLQQFANEVRTVVASALWEEFI